jgi:dethiobiotin synthetase
MNFFLTGTDTNVGKTFVAALLIRSLRAAGLDTVGLKPICCGDRDDAERLHEASDRAISLDDINPVWFRAPVSPYTASIIENRQVDLDQVWERFQKIRAAHRSLIVEGVGGWLVPIRRDYFVSDLAAEMNLPVVVVARNYLGALNHTLLTVENIRARGLQCAGVILNHTDDVEDAATTTNPSVLEDIMNVPILFQIQKDQSELKLSVA